MPNQYREALTMAVMKPAAVVMVRTSLVGGTVVGAMVGGSVAGGSVVAMDAVTRSIS